MDELLGNRIKNLRIERHLTQEQVASAIGISACAYINIERGKKRINELLLSKISHALCVGVNDITGALEHESNLPSGKVAEMLDLFYANKHMYNKLNS